MGKAPILLRTREKELYIDSTDVEANAAIDSLQPRFGVEAQLARLFDEGNGGSAAAWTKLRWIGCAAITTEASAKTMRKRKVWVEPLFQGYLIAAGQNLKRLLSKHGGPAAMAEWSSRNRAPGQPAANFA